MTVFLSKIIGTLVHPLNLAIYLLMFAGILALLRFRRTATVSIVFALAWLTFWSTPFTAEPIYSRWEQQHPPTLPETTPKADWIVILGGGMRGAYRPLRLQADLADASDRVRAGAQLFHAGVAPNVLVTGGSLPWHALGASESEAMQEFLLDLGVPKTAITLEDRSQTTFENAQLSGPILKSHQANRAILVTSAFHMTRSLAVFEKIVPHVQWIPYSTDIKVVPRQRSLIQFLPDTQTLIQSQQYLRERVGHWVYKKRGWI